LWGFEWFDQNCSHVAKTFVLEQEAAAQTKQKDRGREVGREITALTISAPEESR
jgi:hypothetical protein